MKERPILFSTPMVQAILAGRKSQTRRVIKSKTGTFDVCKTKEGNIVGIEATDDEGRLIDSVICPYGKVGDVLWVRETFRPKSHSFPTGEHFEYRATAEVDGNPTDEPWKPCTFMPKDAARIWLKITGVRVERLQDISEEDAKAEGIFAESAKECFQTLWQSINGEGSWNDNPWVWVIEFERIE